jgi:hypothetical protein
MKIELSDYLVGLLRERKNLLDGQEFIREDETCDWLKEYDELNNKIARALSVDFFTEFREMEAA